VLRFSGGPEFEIRSQPYYTTRSELTVQVLTERAIKTAVLDTLRGAGPEHQVDLVMFYFSDRDLVEAFIAAHSRGARLRVLLDPNRDAFGMEKSGIPNRQTAYALHRAGIKVRWADTHGEQCHGKMLYAETGGAATLILGSANYTRRNLENFNLETNVAVRGPGSAHCFRQAAEYFNMLWNNRPGCVYSTGYETYKDHSPLNVLRARLQEQTGLGTF
jgi:phosphatidylserine/phosphatidylglycerophosphate/cardiolipin synthase-like enzyme